MPPYFFLLLELDVVLEAELDVVEEDGFTLLELELLVLFSTLVHSYSL